MQNTYLWKVVPSNQPKVIRNCPKCGNHSEYENSGNFRVNANQNHIDVWLIYQCSKCKSTWNMEILSRINSGAIEKEMYLKFLRNDQELANQYAFDLAAHSRNKSILSYDDIAYEIMGDSIILSQHKDNLQLEITCDYPLEIRIDKILSKQFGISREQIKKMGSKGMIMSEGMKDITKAKLKESVKINLNFY